MLYALFTGSLLGPGTLRFFSITDKGIFRLWSRFFSDWQYFFTYDVIGETDEGKWWVRCIFSCLFCLFMFVDGIIIAILVVWVYARWNINFALHLRQWDNWFVCVAVETCEKKKFDLFLVPGIFRCVPDIFLPYFFGAWYFSTEIQLMRLFFFDTLSLEKCDCYFLIRF